jgi:hypothetical protein
METALLFSFHSGQRSTNIVSNWQVLRIQWVRLYIDVSFCYPVYKKNSIVSVGIKSNLTQLYAWTRVQVRHMYSYSLFKKVVFAIHKL